MKTTEETPPENYYPPILKTTVSSPSAPVSETSDDFKSRYQFSDVAYRISIDNDVPQDKAYLIWRFPTMRRYRRESSSYMEVLKIAIKPKEIENVSDKELVDSTVRYLTLAGMTMLHEYLKLCYMSSEDDTFFPKPETLSVHLIAAVGPIALHYIHRIRDEGMKQPLKYESYWLADFNLKDARERNAFRERLNEIHVLYVMTVEEVLRNKVLEILALEPDEIQHRLNVRTHKGVRFFHAERNGVTGYGVKRDDENPPAPPPPARPITSDTAKDPKSKDNKDAL